MPTEQPLYKVLAQLVVAYQGCIDTQNKEWQEKHASHIFALIHEHMPRGSGFDSGTVFSLDESTPERLLFYTSFHHMDEAGYYDGWTRHCVKVTASLPYTIKLNIDGCNRNDFKEHASAVFLEALLKPVQEGGSK